MFCDFVNREDYPWTAERRHLSGADDAGDIAGITDLVVEVKSGNLGVARWMKELESEISNANKRGLGTDGVVVWRPPGKPDPREWVAMLPVQDFLELWNDRETYGSRLSDAVQQIKRIFLEATE